MSVFKKQDSRNVKATLYIGNLDAQVTESILYELFVQFAPVRSLNLPKDRIVKTHQGYGFVEFKTEAEAKYVIQILKGIRMFGKLLRVRTLDTKSNLASGNNSGGSNNNSSGSVDIGAKIFINNLNPLIDEKYLTDAFSKFGKLVDQPFIDRDSESGESKGSGYIIFDDFDSSDKAIDSLNGKTLMNHKVFVTYAYKDEKRRIKHGDKVDRVLAENAKKNEKKS